MGSRVAHGRVDDRDDERAGAPIKKRRRLGQRGGGRGDAVRGGDCRRRGAAGGEVARTPATARAAAGGAPTTEGDRWLPAAPTPATGRADERRGERGMAR